MPATVSSWSIRRNVREETVDSEEILGASLVEEADGDSDSVESGKGDGTDDTDSEADEEDVREADVGDDDEDEMYDEEEADKEEANESDLDSEFAMSDLESGEEGPSTEEEPPVRRVSVRRRTTASPVKAMTPAKAVGASSSKKFKKATSPKKIEKIFPQKKAVKPKEPLGESLKQDTASRGASVDSDGGDEEEEVFKPKKKR